MTSVLVPAWAWTVAATATPTPSQGPDPSSVSPGLIGFLATFALVAACLLLFTSMVRRLRRMQYRAEHDATQDDTVAGPVTDEEEQGDDPEASPDHRGGREAP